jgi:cytochrome c5
MKLAAIPGVIAISLLFGASPATAADGKAVFEKSCAGCHKAMSPKLTEKDKWAPILKQGTNAMVASVVKGKGVMPPRGGAASNDDVKAAVEYLQTLVK